MASNNIARLGVVLGLDTAEFSAAIDKAILEKQKLAREIKKASNDAAGEIIKLKYATDDYGKSLSKVEEIRREIDAGRFMNAEKGLQAQLLAAAAAYDAKAASMKKFNNVLTDQQKLQLSYQTTDLITQIASGQNALIALLQQGGQLKDALGGVGNMFKTLASFITPARVAMVGLASSFGVVGLAMFQGYRESRQFNDSLVLTGRYAGLTQSTMLDLAKTMSGQLNIAMGDARDIFKDLVASGKFSSESVVSVANAIANVAKFSNESASAVAQKLIPSFDGTSSSARKMNEQYHFLTLEQYKYIEQLERQNRLQESAAYQADLITKKLKDQQPELGYLEQAWNLIAKAASKAWNAMMNWGRQDDTIAKIREIAKEIELLSMRVSGQVPSAAGDRERNQKWLDAKLAEYNRLVELLQKEQQQTMKAEEEAKKIADQQKYGATSRDNQRELLALQYKNRIDLEKQTADEEGKVRLDALQKFFTIRQEFEKKNFEEGGKLYIENLKIYSEKAIEIARETEMSIFGIRAKRAIEFQEEQLKIATEMDEYISKRKQSQQDEYLTQERSLRLAIEQQSYDKIKMESQMGMIGYTQTMIQLEMNRLDLVKRIADIEKQVSEGKISEAQGDLLKKQSEQYYEAQQNAVGLAEKLKLVQNINSALFSNMGSAIDEFVRKGKFSFTNFARSVIQDIIAIQMKASAFNLLGMFVGGTSYAQLVMGSGVPNQFNPPVDYRASGGSVTADSPYVVGEAGPELFVPRQSGTIIPNSQMSNMGGTTNITNYNIQAIDTKSFEDRLYGSANAIWAANTYAQKNLAVNRSRT